MIDDEQYDRLMLKYYDYLWEIRKFVSEKFSTIILLNLNDYPKDIDSIDQEYYNEIAQKIDANNIQRAWFNNIYYVEKKNIFILITRNIMKSHCNLQELMEINLIVLLYIQRWIFIQIIQCKLVIMKYRLICLVVFVM